MFPILLGRDVELVEVRRLDREGVVDKMLGEVEDGGEQLYQWGREWERAAAKSMGEEWIQVEWHL